MTEEVGRLDLESAIRAAIRARLGVAGMTNKELAERTGIKTRTLYNYLGGQTQLFIGTLNNIADALDTTVEELINDGRELMRRGRVPQEGH